ALLDRKLRDGLLFALVKNLKIFLLEVADRSSVLIADHHRHGDQIHAAAEGDRRFVRSDLWLLMLRSLRQDRSSKRGERQDYEADFHGIWTLPLRAVIVWPSE